MAAKKILYIINHMDWFWSHRLALAVATQAQGYEVIIAAPGAAWDRKLTEYNFKGYDLPGGVLPTIPAIRAIIAAEQPGIVHAITLKCAFTAGLAAAPFRDIRLVHTIAGLGYLFAGEGVKPRLLRILAGPLLKRALRRPNTRIIFQNPDDQGLLIRRGFVNPDQCHLIRGSGVDTDKFIFTEEPPYKTPLVVMPTRLVHEKGVAVFIEAARILKQRGIDARYQIAGGLSNGPHAITEDEMQHMTADETVQWLGKVDDMPQFLAGCTLVVYPSWYGEGVPKVLLEAMATGRAIVTTDHPGCREAVTHGENGLLVPVKDSQATGDAIEKILNNREGRIAMGRKGRQRAESEFDVRLVVEKTLKVYA